MVTAHSAELRVCLTPFRFPLGHVLCANMQDQVQQLVQHINQQTAALHSQGFAVKDLSSGVLHNPGMAGELQALQTFLTCSLL